MAYASVGTDIMPAEKRGNIGQVKPTGWHTVKYDFVDGKYLYNRCHLIGYQLTAENACCRVSQLAVNGRDLMAAGIPAGPALRRVLEALLDGVIHAEYPNEKPALLAAAQKIIAS